MSEENATEQTATTTSAEQAADWAALEASAAGAAAASAPPGQAQAPQGPPPPSAEALGVAGLLVGIIRPIATMTVPGIKDAPGELWDPVAEGVAGLLDHYGLAHEAMAGPWARFGFSVAPLVGFVVIAKMNEPEKKDDKPGLYQIPGQMPPPAPEAPPAKQVEPMKTLVQIEEEQRAAK